MMSEKPTCEYCQQVFINILHTSVTALDFVKYGLGGKWSCVPLILISLRSALKQVLTTHMN